MSHDARGALVSNHHTLIHHALTHQVYRVLLVVTRRSSSTAREARDLGAVSLEQVLWFVAAGLSVAVIATLLWGKIRAEAEKDIIPPVAP